MSIENPNALKHMFNAAFLQRMSKALKASYPEFDHKKFLKLEKEMLTLEMKPRVLLVRDELRSLLPKSYKESLRILMDSLNSSRLKGFDLWPYTEFIQTYGLDHLKESLAAQKKITTLFTAEFSIRPFLIHFPQETLKFLLDCSKSSDVHVRRWASEGSRPRLPWGQKIHAFIENPHLTLPILEHLHQDSELYVQKSVANHLNDISKDHPELVIGVLRKWQKDCPPEKKMFLDWIQRHALRTLIKKGHTNALKISGVDSTTKIAFKNLQLDKAKYQLNEKLSFSFSVKSLEKKTKKLIIDYRIHFVKANGSLSPKVFKLKSIELGPSEQITISKSHSLKKVTTRAHYDGLHQLEIMINGQSCGKKTFHLAH